MKSSTPLHFLYETGYDDGVIRFLRVLPAIALFMPWEAAQAQCNCPSGAPRCLCLGLMGTGATYTFWTVTGNIITFLAESIGFVAVAMFIVGALMIVLAGVKEENKQKGKDLMLGSVLSMGVVLGAYALLRVIDFFLS